MSIQRIRSVMRLLGVALLGVMGMIMWSSQRTLKALSASRGRQGQPHEAHRAKAWRLLGAGLTEQLTLERLLRPGFVVHFRADVSGDGQEELMASSAPLPGSGGKLVARAVVLTRRERGWVALLDTADPSFWRLEGADRDRAARHLGLTPTDDPGAVLADLGAQRLDRVSPERIVVVPTTPNRQREGPKVTFDWDRQGRVYRPRILNDATAAKRTR